MGGESPGNKRKGESSTTGTFHGRPCLWFLCFSRFFCVSVTPWRRGVWASYLRPTVPLGGEDKTAGPCCRCSPAPPGWWCVGDTWKDRRTELTPGSPCPPFGSLCGAGRGPRSVDVEVKCPSLRPRLRTDGVVLTAEGKCLSLRKTSSNAFHPLPASPWASHLALGHMFSFESCFNVYCQSEPHGLPF